jgi:hypothetical protein
MKKSILGLLASLLSVCLPVFGQVTQKKPQLINISNRGFLSVGETRTVGFVITAQPGSPLNSSKQLIIRGVGPGLAPFGVTGTLSDPKLVLYQGQQKVAENDNWGGTAAETAVFDQVGAFRLPQGSKDAVISINLPVLAGSAVAYTVMLSAASGDSGVGLIEVYDVQRDTGALELVNMSVLGTAGVGNNSFIVGFTFDGVGTKNVLVRAVGPELGSFGVGDFLLDPSLSFRYQTAANTFNTVSVDNWSGENIPAMSSRVGAFPLSAGSRSAAFAGLMTVTGATSATATVIPVSGSGRVLVEVYTLDP